MKSFKNTILRGDEMRVSVILTIVLCSCLSLAQSADRPPQQTAQAKQYFIAIFSRGAAWRTPSRPMNRSVSKNTARICDDCDRRRGSQSEPGTVTKAW